MNKITIFWVTLYIISVCVFYVIRKKVGISWGIITFFFSFSISKEGSPRGIVANALAYDMVVSRFNLQSFTNTPGKDMNPFIPTSNNYISTVLLHKITYQSLYAIKQTKFSNFWLTHWNIRVFFFPFLSRL